MAKTADRQVVLITGASGGLGPSVTRAFLDSGATVAASSRRIEQSDNNDFRFHAFPADLLDPAAATALADAVVAKCGRIDALIHVAGGFSGGALHETSDAVWDQMMNLNLRAAFNAFRAVLPHMRRAGRGRIVAIGSRAAVDPAAGIAAYAASKAAMLSLVRSIALENADAGIVANAILPGTIDTEANRQWGSEKERAKWVSPARIAQVAVFLASDAAAQVNGAALPMYGGA
jgi:NAD(P)-dependent dehydrogenase (short-subunit alcohol dehydrogenase family)